MKIMTFNVRINVPTDGENGWSNRFKKIAQVINQETPIIIGMQEPNKLMMKDLHNEISNYQWIGKPRRENDEHCPIFYQEDIVELLHAETFWLSEHPDVGGSISWNADYPRICTWGEFALKENTNNRFRVFNTHLDHISEEARTNGIRLIWDVVSQLNKQEKLPTILMGDFNSYPDSDTVQFLEKETSFVNAYSIMSKESSLRKTFHDFDGGYEGEPIDYIFTSPSVSLLNMEINTATFQGMYPSDHYPVTVKIQLPTQR